MKIAIVAHLDYPIAPPFAGGLEKHTQTLADGLSQRGHEVVLFADPTSKVEGEVAKLCESLENFKSHHLHQQNLDFYKEYLCKHYSYMEIMQYINNDDSFDIIHNNSLHYVPVSFVPLLRTPMVSVLHTPPLRELEFAYQSLPMKTFDHQVVSVSFDLATQWRQVTKINQIVHNGVAVPETFSNRTPEDYAFWFGRIVPEKGLEDAIMACLLAGIKLRFAGPKSDLDYFNAKVAPLMDDNCEYLGHLNSEEVNRELEEAALAIITPKWNEPFGLVAAEALAAGVPVAAYKRGAIGEIVDESVGRTVTPDDIKALSYAVIDVKNRSFKQCWEKAKNYFSIERMISNYESIYKKVIDQKTHKDWLLHPPRRFGAFTSRTGSGSLSS